MKMEGYDVLMIGVIHNFIRKEVEMFKIKFKAVFKFLNIGGVTNER